MVSCAEKSVRGLDKYSRSVWEPFLKGEFSSIRGKRVLDLGCGLCRYTGGLKNNNEVTRVDINNNEFVDVVCNAEKLPFEDGYFDEVIAIGLLDYTDPVNTVSEIFRVLKNGGLARIMVPNILNPYVRVATTFGPSRSKKRGFGVYQFVNLFHRTGFFVVDVTSMGFCFWVPTKMLQEGFIRLFMVIDWLTNGKYGNNIYLVARKI